MECCAATVPPGSAHAGQRAGAGTAASVASMCCPQPSQVGWPQPRQATLRHMTGARRPGVRISTPVTFLPFAGVGSAWSALVSLMRAALLSCLAAAASAAPCDILPNCVAAHSLLRALYDDYSGPLYRVQRVADNASLDIGLLAPGGTVNATAQDVFCAPPPPPPLPLLSAVPPLNSTVAPRRSPRGRVREI